MHEGPSFADQSLFPDCHSERVRTFPGRSLPGRLLIHSDMPSCIPIHICRGSMLSLADVRSTRRIRTVVVLSLTLPRLSRRNRRTPSSSPPTLLSAWQVMSTMQCAGETLVPGGGCCIYGGACGCLVYPFICFSNSVCISVCICLHYYVCISVSIIVW